MQTLANANLQDDESKDNLEDSELTSSVISS